MNLNDARSLAEELMQYHIATPWHFKFDSAKKRFGCCNYTKRTISLSSHLTALSNEKDVLNTIIHEVSHAIVGKGHGHDEAWRATCLSLGGNGKRCGSHVSIPAKYKAQCYQCKATLYRHRRSKVACKRCCRYFNNGVFTERYLFEWRLA